MKNTLITVAVVILIALGIFAFIQRDGVAPDTSDQDQQANDSSNLDQAPEFSLEDYDGNTVALSDHSGKVRVVNSWATWCPFCVNELPDFGELQNRFGNEIVVIAIDRQEPLDEAKGFTDDLGVTDEMIYLLDPSDSFYRSIGGFTMPETLFINKDGKIVFHKRGFMSLDEMVRRTEDALDS